MLEHLAELRSVDILTGSLFATKTSQRLEVAHVLNACTVSLGSRPINSSGWEWRCAASGMEGERVLPPPQEICTRAFPAI